MHAPLSPSAAYRWLKCLGSAYLENKYVRSNNSSQAAIEGSNRHTLVNEFIFRNQGLRNKDLKPNTGDKLVDNGINQLLTMDYELNTLTVDQILITSHFSNMYGTPDATVCNDKEIVIIDFKFGNIKVDVVNNLQLMCYLSLIYLIEYTIDALNGIAYTEDKIFKLVIIQPSVFEEPQIHTVTIDEVKKFIKTLEKIDIMFDALNDIQEEYISDNIYSSGNHCQYCNVKDLCPVQHNNINKIVNNKKLDIEDKINIIQQKRSIIEALDAFEKEVISYLMFNKHTHAKVKSGASRKYWKDDLDALAFLSNKIPEDKLLSKKLISPSKLLELDPDFKEFVQENTKIVRNKSRVVFED